MLQVPRDIEVAFDRKIQEALVRREECPDYPKWLFARQPREPELRSFSFSTEITNAQELSFRI